MGGAFSSFGRRRLAPPGGSSSSKEEVASLGRARNLQEALLHSYVESLSPSDIEMQFGDSGAIVLKRFYLCGVLVDRESLEHIMSYLDASSLMRAIETSKTFFQIADTPWIWDALDGLNGITTYSMGRYDYQVRHRRMRLTDEERRSHLAKCHRAELEEHREKKYREDSLLARFKCT